MQKSPLTAQGTLLPQRFYCGFDASFALWLPFAIRFVGFAGSPQSAKKRLEIRLKPIDWATKDTGSTRDIDCIWNGFTITEHAKPMHWTKPYVQNKQLIWSEG